MLDLPDLPSATSAMNSITNALYSFTTDVACLVLVIWIMVNVIKGMFRGGK